MAEQQHSLSPSSTGASAPARPHWHSSELSAERILCTSSACLLPRSASPSNNSTFWSSEIHRGTKRRATPFKEDDNVLTGGSTTAAASLVMLASAGITHPKEEINTLTFDARTGLPPRDVVDELLSHTESEFNLVSKVLQPKALNADYAQGRLSDFLLLAVIANNAMFSTHPAVAGAPVAASRQLIDRAKAYVPDALETPTIANCQALLLLAVAYMHQGKMDVSNHYSSMSLRILHQLGVYKIDDNAWSDEGGWITESWLEREQIRRVIWGSFTVDTFLALMLHCPPNILVDLSGVNRPCAQNVWYVGNDNLDSLAMPASCGFGAKPGDSAYLAALKQLKLGGVPWRINGTTTVQLNFAVLGNALLRSISDPQTTQSALDSLVNNSFRALNEWLATVPAMPSRPTLDEIHHTLMISSAAMCLKSVVTPYLVTRSNSAVREEEEASDRMVVDYINNACQVYRYTRLTVELVANKSVPAMFIAYSTMIIGGIFAACAYAAPTPGLQRRFGRCTDFLRAMCRDCARKSLLFENALAEIERVEEMVRFLPRRLDSAQLLRIRDLLIPRSIEAAVGKRFSTFVGPIRNIMQSVKSTTGGDIPLTSNLCAIFGQKTPHPHQSLHKVVVGCGKIPDYKLTYTAISSLLIALSSATKDESYFAFMLKHLDVDDDECKETADQTLSPMRPADLSMH
ncbi:hypothetical protein GGI20_002916 [Coemansia sp. BCRC 34301]|nr:hypothetical protein GGI20_002916 [Coemansia sp. BCRC 34301]